MLLEFVDCVYLQLKSKYDTSFHKGFNNRKKINIEKISNSHLIYS